MKMRRRVGSEPRRANGGAFFDTALRSEEQKDRGR